MTRRPSKRYTEADRRLARQLFRNARKRGELKSRAIGFLATSNGVRSAAFGPPNYAQFLPEARRRRMLRLRLR